MDELTHAAQAAGVMMKQLMRSVLGLICLGVLNMGTVVAQPRHPNATFPNATGNGTNFPMGSQIYQNGTITTPTGRTLYPNNTIRHGDGTTTFYYPDGTRITTQERTINPSGTDLSPGSNGGLQPITPIMPIVPPSQNRF